MAYQFLIFLILALLIIGGVHFYLYATVIKFFSLAAWPGRGLLFFLPLAFSLSFILASILTRSFANGAVKDFYYFSGLWLGIMNYLMIAATLAWLVYGLAKLMHFNLDTRWLMGVLFALALIVAAYGVYNSGNPRVKNITIKIKNLPEYWQGKTVVQMSDVHLGAIKGTAYIERVVAQANRQKPELVLITGDYFDGTCPNLSLYSDELKKINAPQGMVFISGNHETYIGLDKVKAALAGLNLKYLEDETINIEGLNILGLAYSRQGAKGDVSAVLQTLDPSAPNIFLSHEPRYTSEAKAAGVDLELSGHTHAGQLWPYNFFTALIYKKYYTGLHSEDGFNIYTTTGTGVWGPPMRVGSHSEIVAIKFE